MDVTEKLIQSLSERLEPVYPLAPPMKRAAVWLVGVTLLSILLVLGFSRLGLFMSRARDAKLEIELVATLLTGILAVVAAFELSLPDRTFRWLFLPLPSLALWLASSGYSCWEHRVSFGPEPMELGETPRCFAWIIGFGLPLVISLFLVLRRARPLTPGPVAAMAGLGAASIAAFLLQFFHPFDVTFLDLALHLSAVIAVVAIARSAGQKIFSLGA